MKSFLKAIVTLFGKLLGSAFYDKQYLSGQHFDNNHVGWYWVIKAFIRQKIFFKNFNAKFPVSGNIYISNANNIKIGKDSISSFQSFGIYFQNIDAEIVIGDNCYIAPNVGLITTNHDLTDLSSHLPGKAIVLGNSCWIGMNSVILPGVSLGNNTIVGAGSVVTKSFEQGNVVLAGNPARIIKEI